MRVVAALVLLLAVAAGAWLLLVQGGGGDDADREVERSSEKASAEDLVTLRGRAEGQVAGEASAPEGEDPSVAEHEAGPAKARITLVGELLDFDATRQVEVTLRSR